VSPLGGFAHGIRHGVCLANAHTNGAIRIANHYRYTKLEAAAAFYNFGNPGDLDNFFFVLLLDRLLIHFHNQAYPLLLRLEIQASFTSRICQGFHPADVAETTPVEHNLLDAFFQGALGNCFSNQTSLFGFFQSSGLGAEFSIHTGCGNKGVAGFVIDHLGVNLSQAAEDAQARAIRRAMHELTNTDVTANASFRT
jgi:hypothetical protein